MQAIIEVRWSPDSDTVALGGEDFNIYLYSTGDNFDLVATAEKHKHPVRQVLPSSHCYYIDHHQKRSGIFFGYMLVLIVLLS